MDKAKEALWTRSFVLDTLINFLVFLIYYLLIVIIAVVAKDNLHATARSSWLGRWYLYYWYCCCSFVSGAVLLVF